MSAATSTDDYPKSLSQEQLRALFPVTPRPPLKPKAFEFALVLAGTVSAGAYSAGVLDFILEALDVWTRAKDAGSPDAPMHDAVLSTIAGASGGAINGAILTRVASFGFPHGPVTGNPFYDVWVHGPNLNALLTPDSSNKGLVALFNTTTFESLARNLVKLPGPALGTGNSPTVRSYLADPLRLFMMVANVTGIPYRINFRGESGLGHDLIGHADYTRFGLTVPGGVPNDKLSRPDEFPLCASSALNWNIVADSALATSAFPAAFPSQPLHRDLAVLGYRVAVVPGENQNQAEVAQLVPLWSSLAGGITDGSLRTVNVDGGTLNNEPLEYARTALAGYNGRNRRDGTTADRGVVLIDPFSDPEKITLFDPPGLLGLLGPLVSTLVMQARFKPEDIALASDYDTYSRFLVAPVGVAGGVTEVKGSGAIAAGGLGGFLGFIDWRFLDYDFKLGRYNAYKFLTEEFVLPSDNDLFQPPWTEAQIAVQKVPEKNPGPGRPSSYLPIVPVMPALRAAAPTQPTNSAWPRLKGVPSDLSDRIGKRLDSVYASLKSDLQTSKTWPGGFIALLVNQAYSWFLKGLVQNKVVSAFQQALNDQNLLPTYVQNFPKTPAGRSSAQTAQKEWSDAGAKSSDISETVANWVLTTLW